MGRADLIGNGKHQLVPAYQPLTDGSYQSARRKNSTPALQASASPPRGRMLTQHTGPAAARHRAKKAALSKRCRLLARCASWRRPQSVDRERPLRSPAW